MGKLVIVGTVAFDEIETPFGKTDKILGGAGTFIGLAASQFDVDSAIVSIVGDDLPQKYLDLLSDNGIDLEGLEIVQGGKTFYWKGKYHNDLNSRDTLITELNTLADFNPKVPDNYKDADVVMLGNLHPAVQLSVINQMSKRPKLIVLDTMNFWMDSALEDLKEVIKHIDVITINDEEARQLTEEYSLVRAAQEIHKMGPKFVVIKKGEHGALLFHNENVFFAPALPLEEVFDPTGAGDTFAGGFMGYLSSQGEVTEDTMRRAMVYGTIMSSFNVEEFGTERVDRLTHEEINNRFAEFKRFTHFEEVPFEKASSAA